MPAFSARYDAALAFAARAHRSQLRKGTDIPYIAHVVHVSTILLRYGFGEDIIIAALLHDVTEDCGVPLTTIVAEFGPNVARLVDAVSESQPAGGDELSWEQRKTAKLVHLQEGGPDVAAVKAADALHNAKSVAADLQQYGPQLWQRFKRGPEPTLWYYRSILSRVQAHLGESPLVYELAAAIDEVAQLVKQHAEQAETRT